MIETIRAVLGLPLRLAALGIETLEHLAAKAVIGDDLHFLLCPCGDEER